jgi:hypothetical protein
METVRTSVAEMQDQMAVYSQTLRDMPSKASILAVLEDKLSAFKQEIESKTISQNTEMKAVGQGSKLDAKPKENEFVALKQEIQMQAVSQATNLKKLYTDIANIKKSSDNIEDNSVIRKLMKDLNKLKTITEELEARESNPQEIEEQNEVVLKILYQCVEELRQEYQKHNKIQDDKISSLEIKVANLEFSTGGHASEQELRELKAQINELEDVGSEDKIEHILERVVSLEQNMSSANVQSTTTNIESSELQGLKDDMIKRFKDLDTKLKLEHSEASGKIDEILANVETADEQTMNSIEDIKANTREEIGELLQKIIDIKNEMMNESKMLEDKFDSINQQEDSKHDAVLSQISEMEINLSSQYESITKITQSITEITNSVTSQITNNVTNQNTTSETTVDSSVIDTKILNLKSELMGEIEDLELVLNQDKEFERERILN